MTLLEDTTHALQKRRLNRTEITISYVLRFGVLICTGIILLGFLMKLGTQAGLHSSGEEITALSRGQTLSSDQVSKSIENIFSGVQNKNPNDIIVLGIVALIALPVLRVGMTVLVFLFERDWIFFGITLIVFGVLMSGIFFGRTL